MSTTQRTWDGPTDISTPRLPTDYFIPRTMQCDYLELQKVLVEFLTEERLCKLQKVASLRTRRILPVFESTHHSHNISAVLRTCDAFGFQDTFFVYSPELMRFRLKDSVERGASNWLSARRASDISSCAKILKKSGYKIALVSLPSFCRTADHYENTLPSFAAHEISLPAFEECVGNAPVAVVFGNEFHGVSPLWVEHADLYLHVDMTGFVESLNVSVCAGILLHGLKEKLCRPEIDFSMPDRDRALLLEHWIVRSCANGYEIIAAKYPHLTAYYNFLKHGGFFAPFLSPLK